LKKGTVAKSRAHTNIHLSVYWKGERKMRCPKCGRRIKEVHKVYYGVVYVCKSCGIVIIDFALKIQPKGG